MADPQMAYMMSSQAMMNPAMYSIPNMSASPVPHMYMNSMSMGTMNNNMGSAMNMYGNMGSSMPMDNASGGGTGTPSTPTKLETSNLTSKPVQSIDQPPQPPLASASSSPVAHMAGASSPVNTLSPSSVPAAAATPPLHRTTSSDTNATILASNAAAAAAPASNMAEAPPKPSVYIPKTRLVETYGGIDIKVFEKYDAKPPVMLFEELGTVDMHALIMSLKSGLPMEMTNALNTLTTLSKVAKPLHLFLRECDDLLDTLLDALEAAVDKARLSCASSPSNNAKDETSYPQLFETALDEMKSLIPRLEDTSSDTWLPRRELCWCILNILRNLSYLPENQQTMADDQRCIDVLTHLVDLTRHYEPAVSLEDEHDFMKNGENGETIANGTEKVTSIEFRSVDILDCRKSVLLIFANVAQALGKTPLLHASALQSLVSLTHDFIVHGHDTYYCAVAIDTWNKLVVRDFHRQLLAHVLEARFSTELAPNGAKKVLTLADDTQVTLTAFPDADAAQLVASQLGNMLAAMVKMLRRQFYLLESGRVMALDQPQLTTLETLMMGLYTVVAVADSRLCSQWIENDKQMPASIARIALTLALMNQNHLRIAAHRALDVVYVLVLGGAQRLAALQSANATLDPRRHTTSSSSSSSSASTSSLSRRNHFTITAHSLDDSDTEYVRDVASRARALLYASNIQDKLVMAMLNPAADPVILNLMDDLLSSLNSFTHLQTE
ncbi:hypothetical protein BC940DRAFT_301788 [Gongronella butleri]|nr:hypothetical protein BC940DRAFT_301788 [Gongronella butleri]